MTMQRTYGNRSSVNFASFRQPEINPQLHRIYQNHTQIGELMNDFAQGAIKTQARYSQNIVANVTQKYDVPLFQHSFASKQNKGYLQFFDHHRVFVKPYASNTKFIDLLNRNKSLLRTDPPEATLSSDKSAKLQKKKAKNNRKYRYFRHTEKSQTFTIPKKEENEHTEMSQFDKTISTQFSLYKSLMNKSRSQKSQSVLLNNSINRILAAQKISQELHPRSRHFHLTEGEA